MVLVLLGGDSLKFFILPCCDLPSTAMNSVGYLTSGAEVGLVFFKLGYSFEELVILYESRSSFCLPHS